MTERVGEVHIHELPYNTALKPLKVGDVYRCPCDQEFVIVPVGTLGMGWQPIEPEQVEYEEGKEIERDIEPDSADSTVSGE